MPTSISAPGRTRLSRLVAGEGEFYQALKAAKRPLIIVGQGALIGCERRAPCSRRPRGLPPMSARSRDDWIGLSILHTAASRVGGLDIGFVPGEGGHRHAGMMLAPATEPRRAVPARRRRGRPCRDGRVRRLYRHARRCRRAPRRRDPARRRLHRKIRHLGQHRGPRADRQPRRLPAGRRARGLVDPARALRRRSARRCRSTASASFAPGSIRRIRTWREQDAIRPAEQGGLRSPCVASAAHSPGPAFVSPIRDFYLTNPIARASAVMAECSAMHLGPAAEAAE